MRELPCKAIAPQPFNTHAQTGAALRVTGRSHLGRQGSHHLAQTWQTVERLRVGQLNSKFFGSFPGAIA